MLTQFLNTRRQAARGFLVLTFLNLWYCVVCARVGEEKGPYGLYEARVLAGRLFFQSSRQLVIFCTLSSQPRRIMESACCRKTQGGRSGVRPYSDRSAGAFLDLWPPLVLPHPRQMPVRQAVVQQRNPRTSPKNNLGVTSGLPLYDSVQCHSSLPRQGSNRFRAISR